MATRMMTLLYGDKPEADVEPGNRVDTADDQPPASLPPIAPEAHAPHGHHFALRGLVLGLAAAAAVLVGVTIALVALVWAHALTPAVQVTLVVLGLLLIAAGTAYVVGKPTHTAR
jgi:hypothetical protein